MEKQTPGEEISPTEHATNEVANDILETVVQNIGTEEVKDDKPPSSNSQVLQIAHTDILDRLLKEIHTVNFRDVLGMGPEENIMQKDIVVGVIRSLLKTAKLKMWSLCQSNGYLYAYNGAYWKQCSEGDLKKFLSDAAERMGVAHKEAKHFEFASKLLRQFLFDGHFPPPVPDENKVTINLQNGTFEFTSSGWERRDFDAKDFFTYQLPFAYEPDAKCPEFDKYLLRVLPDKDSRDVLQEYAGFIFTKLNLEKCLILSGSGGNGKSVFFNILISLLGRENVLTYPIGLFSHEYKRAKLTNVLVNYSSEKGFDLEPDTFKALVSGEPLQAREPRGRSFTIFNKVKFIINCNELPRETEQTEAYFRRLVIVPFNEKITAEEMDIELGQRIITNELPGVFNWLLRGLVRLTQEKQFTHCAESDKAVDEFRKQSDYVHLFLEEYGYNLPEQKPEQKPDAVFLADLYSRYKDFCREDNYRPLGKNKFSARLVKKGFAKDRNKLGYYFLMTKAPA